ncbi:acyltransferase family protein [Ruegeria arenilitoris]|uniref:acyltransferase family protein n=1 Tax=Ruegeria arenilitoris TaxID=1173585 RepID=UPI001FD1B6B4|nr:acyltransferase family protein [Ruegeria arenilitoris]
MATGTGASISASILRLAVLSIAYRREIDGLRAIAVLPVVFYHAGLSWLSGGFLGVDVFFVISGYLITSLLIGDIQRGRLSIVDFYERRARRILPALFVVLAVTTCLAWIWMLPADLRVYSRSLSSVAVFLSNVFFFRNKDYFADEFDMHPLLHTWSLAVEEQFYLLFPLLLLFLFRRGTRTCIIGLTVLLLASLLLAQWTSENEPRAGFYLIYTRAWELLAGAICAFVPRQDKGRFSTVLPLLGMAGLLVSYVIFDRYTPHPSFLTVVPVLGTVLVILFSSQRDPVGALLSSRIMVWIGLISYSLYLWHYPLLVFAKIRSVPAPSPLTVASLVVLAFVLSALTWRFVEQPFRRRREGLFSRRGIFIGSAAISALVFSVGVAIFATDGAPDRKALRDLDLPRLTESLAPNRGLSNECNGRMPVPDSCATSESPKVAVWGDSFAMHLVVGLTAAYPKLGVVQLTKSLCAPIAGIAFADRGRTGESPQACLDFSDQVLDYVTSTDSIDYVIVSSPFYYLFEPGGLAAVDGAMDPAGPQSTVLRNLEKTLERLVSAGKTPIVVSPPPSNGQNLGYCVVNAELRGADPDLCDYPFADIQPELLEVAEMLHQLEGRHKVVWLDRILCDADGMCRASDGSTAYYRDGRHLSKEGSRELGCRTGGWFLFGDEPDGAADTGAVGPANDRTCSQHQQNADLAQRDSNGE